MPINQQKSQLVTRLSEYRNRETIGILEQLLEQAKQGAILGILFCVRIEHKHHAMGVAGCYHADPAQAVTACSRMTHRLNLMIDQMEVLGADSPTLSAAN